MKQYIAVFRGIDTVEFRITPHKDLAEWWITVQTGIHKMHYPNSRFFAAIYYGKKILGDDQ